MARTTTYSDFDKEYTAFARKHNAKAERYEFSSLRDNTIHKTVSWSDGAIWWEITECEYFEQVEVIVHGIEMTVSVPLRRTEYWSTEDPESKYFYQKA